MYRTCKQAPEEFINSRGEFVIGVIGLEIHFSPNRHSIHIDLHEQAFAASFNRFFS